MANKERPEPKRQGPRQIDTTLGALAVAEDALTRLGALRLSARHSYHIVKLTRLARQELQHWHERRNALLVEFGTPRAEAAAAGQYDIGGENLPKFKLALEELAAVPVILQWAPVTLSMLDGQQITPMDLDLLGPLFDEGEATT